MPGNLSLVVNANTAEARSQLALVQADIRSLGASLRTLAKDGDSVELHNVAGQFESARAAAAKFNAELKEGSVSAFTRLNEVVKGPLEGLAMLKSSMRETAELAGVVFVVDKIREFVVEMGELGERALNTASALGITAEQYQQLSESMQLVGGDADALVRAERQLNSAAQTAAGSDMSRQADAFRALKINAAQFADTLRKDPIAALKQLADAYKATGGAGGEAGPFGILLGRSLASLVPYLRDGAEGVDRLQKAVKDLGSPTQDTLERLDKMGEATNRAEVAIKNFGIGLGDLVAGPGQRWIDWLAESYAMGTRWTRLWSGVALPQLAPGPGAAAERYRAGRNAVAGLGDEAYGGGETAALPPPPPSNKDMVAAWLQAAGYSPQAGAAVMGNAQVESGFNPGAKGPGGHFGMFQWDQDRQKPLGGSTDIATQMELMDRELEKLDPAFRTATGDVAELTKRFEGEFERSGGQLEAKRVAAAGSISLPDVSVTGQSGDFVNSQAEKKALDEQLKALEDKKKLTDANFAYQIQAAKEDAALQAQLAQQKEAADVAYYAQRQTLINSASAVVQRQYRDEAAGAVEAKTRELAADQHAADQRVAIAVSILQRKLALDQQAEASELKLAAGRLALAHATAEEIAAAEIAIVTGHRDAQEKILASEAQVAAGRIKIEQQIVDEKTAIDQRSVEKILDIELTAAQTTAKAWNAAVKQIGDQFATMATDVIMRTKTIGQAFVELIKSLLSDLLKSAFKSLFESALGIGGGGGSGGGSGGGGLMGGVFSDLFGSIFKGGLSSLIGNPFSGAGGAAEGLLGGVLGNPFSASSGGLLGGLFGGLFGGGAAAAGGASAAAGAESLLPLIALGFSRGGVVPAASQGWVVPRFAGGGSLPSSFGTDSVLSALTPGETVLPAGFQGGGGHVFNISAVDAGSVARLFMSNGSALVAAINRAGRMGSPLTQS